MKAFLLVFTFLGLACATAYSQNATAEIKTQTGDVGSTWKSLSKALKDVDTRYYKIEIVRKRNPETLGNAELGRLKLVSLFGARETNFSTGNLIEVKARGKEDRETEFIKLIWTTDAMEEIKEKVEEVNNILKKANSPE